MKNLRNHLIDDGAILEDGTIIEKKTLSQMIAANGVTYKLCPKLSPAILELKGAERMRVAPAVQVLSNHMSILARHVFQDQPKISEFFKTVNDGFDVLNSRIPKDDSNPLKSGYSIDCEIQRQALEKMKQLLLTMRFRTKKNKNVKTCLLPFQKGFVVSIDALLQLAAYLRKHYGVTYILTSRLNQDALESFFSVIRSFSGLYSNPTPPEFRYRLRLIILGCRIRPPRGTNAVFDEANITYVSGELLQKNEIAILESCHRRGSDLDCNEEENLIPEAEPTEDCSLTTDAVDYSTEEGMRYVAGYLAFKLKKLNLGIYGKPTSTIQLEPNNTKWIELLSRGGLLVPDESIFNWVKICEEWYRKWFPILLNERNISKKLENKICTGTSVCPVVVKHYLKTRIRMSVKQLNEEFRQSKVYKRKSKQFSAGAPTKVSRKK
jgi:hypothetical protein